MTRLVFGVLIALFTSTISAADRVISLGRFLDIAIESGLPLIYSSAVVRPRMRIAFDDSQPVTLDQVRGAIKANGLRLEQLEKQWLVKPGREITPSPPSAAWVEIEAPRLEEIVVQASAFQILSARLRGGQSLERFQLESFSSPDQDPIKTALKLAGAASNGLGVKPHFRGGASDETALSINGFEIYAPYHLPEFGGLLSPLETQSVDHIQVYTGNSPIYSGNHLSGLMEISLIEPTLDETTLGMGLLHAKALVLRTSGDRHLLVSARRSNLDWLSELIESDHDVPSFSDALFHWGRDIGDQSTLAIGGLWFGDRTEGIGFNTIESSSGQRQSANLWFDLRTAFSDRLNTRWMSQIKLYEIRRLGELTSASATRQYIDDTRNHLGWRNEARAELRFNPEMTLSMGMFFELGKSRYTYRSSKTASPLNVMPLFTSHPVSYFNADIDTRLYGGFLNFKAKLNERLTGELGVRIDQDDYLPAGEESAQPRLNLRYRMNESTDVRFSWGYYEQIQAPHALQLGDGETEFRKRQRSTQTEVTIDHRFRGLSISLSGYRKAGHRINGYFNNLYHFRSLMPELQADRVFIPATDIKVLGSELRVSGLLAEIAWYMAASHSHARDLSRLGTTPKSWDQDYALTIGINRSMGGWHVGADFAAHSGWRISPPSSIGANGLTSPLNDKALPHFSSLNLRLERSLLTTRGSLNVEFGMTNVLNRDNALGFVSVSKPEGLADELQYGFPRLPYAHIEYSF